MKIFKFKRQFIALLLCMTMILGLMPGTANALELTTTNEGLSLSGDSGSSEVIALREENIKHFDMGNGTFQAIAYSHPVHKLDSDGNWQDIDFGMTLTGTRSSRVYANEEAGAAFAENYVANQPIMTLSDEENAISMSLITTNVNSAARLNTNTTIAAEVTNPQNSFQTIEDAKSADFSSKILYEEVFPGVDLEYIVDPGTVKENIIVNEKATTYQYSFALNLTGLYPVMQDDGSIIVYDQDADTKEYEIPAPFMYDALGNVSEDVAYALIGSGNTYTLTVTANADWINTEGRNFPVTIDPTYVVSTEDTYDTYIDGDSPDTPHGSNSMLWVRSNRVSYIRVPTPSVPDGSSVDWAELVAYYYYFDYVTSGAVNVSAHRVTGGSWNEDALTWNSIANVSNYGLSTATLDTVTAAAGSATASSPAQANFTITDTFKNWVNGTNSNYGIGLKYATGSTNLSVVFKSSEASYTYRPRITYQYTPYVATVNCYFDNGYSVYYGETNAVSSSEISSYLVAIKERYLELLGLHLNISTISYYASPIDICKGTVTSSNINELCSCGNDHTNRDNVLLHFKNTFPGNDTTTTVYWTGHRILSVETNGNTNENRSCSWYNNIYMLERNVNNREIASIGVLMHELNHQYGAPDHYHELADSSDESSCKFKDICSTCGVNPRPSTCIMNSSRKDISPDSIICNACRNDMKTHLNDHH